MEARAAYAYRAVDASGRVVTGSISAANEAEVNRRVRAEGKIVLEIIRDLPGMAGRERQVREQGTGDRRVRRAELVGFCRQMGVNAPATIRNTKADIQDTACNCNKTSETSTVCTVDLPAVCTWEQPLTETTETCG